jgi:hypothetical protein
MIEASDILVEYPNIGLSLNVQIFGTLLIDELIFPPSADGSC